MRPLRAPAGWLALGLLWVLLGTSACTERGETASAPQSEASASAPLGALVVSAQGERVTVRCADALAAEVLDRLAEAVGFELAPGPRPAKRVRLDLEDVRAEEALLHVLGGLPYAVEYESDTGGRARISRVRIAGGDAPPPVERKVKKAKARPLERPRDPDPRERPEPPRRWTAADDEELEEELVERLESRDPEVRADALTELDADPHGMDRLSVLALDDPEVSVRLAAVEHLEGEDAWGAVNVVIKALEDDDPAVVARAVEAIASLGDETLLPMLVALQDHRDPRVREAVGEAIEFLE